MTQIYEFIQQMSAASTASSKESGRPGLTKEEVEAVVKGLLATSVLEISTLLQGQVDAMKVLCLRSLQQYCCINQLVILLLACRIKSKRDKRVNIYCNFILLNLSLLVLASYSSIVCRDDLVIRPDHQILVMFYYACHDVSWDLSMWKKSGS